MKEEMKDIGALTPRVSPIVSVLLALAARCEAEEPSEELDHAIHDALLLSGRAIMWDEYSRSLDAAVTLCPPQFGFRFQTWKNTHTAALLPTQSADIEAEAKTPALALCAAALRAHASMQSGEANPPPQGSAP